MDQSQLRLLAGLVAPAALVVLLAGVGGTQRDLERQHDESVRSLTQRAQLVRDTVSKRPLVPEAREELDALADRLALAAEARVTLVARNGEVVGDSRVPLDRLAPLQNHADRPEISEALAGRVGTSQRRSNTVGDGLLYVAVPVDAGRGGAVRLALPATHSTATLWRVLGMAGAAGFVLAAVLSVVLTRRANRPLVQIRKLTDAVVAGNLRYRLPRGQPAPVAAISESIQSLAQQLRARLAETTEEKERLQAVLDGMTEGVLVIEPDGGIVLANDRLREFFGVTGTLTGRTTLEVIRNADLAELLLSAYTKAEPVSCSIHLTRPLQRALRVHAVSFPAGAPEPTGTVAVFHDVTELMQLEKMRRDFVANASHELRTPLAAIRGFAETLLDSPQLSEQDRRSYLEVIDRHAKRLGALVADLLELSRIESGKTTLSPTAVDLGALATALLRENRRRFEERGLEVSHDSTGNTLAWADASAVEQILTNLFDNALKYTEPGGKLHLEVSGDDRMVQVALRDTGIGIPEEDLKRIFERFYRVDKARSRAAGGTGLGLAIVKHLVHGMEGEISVESQPGVGSTFRFALPRA